MRTYCSFSGIYRGSAPKEEMLDLSDLAGTNGYCSEESQARIRERLAGRDLPDVHFLDNGNYHYMTKLWLEMLRTPFDLVVFDHHTDLQVPALLPALSCGGWIRDVLADKRIPVRQVFLIGPPENAAADVLPAWADRICFVTEKEAETPEKCVQKLFGAADDRPVYLSVDKDVLSASALSVNWDQGGMTPETLLRWIAEIAARRQILGADLCGEPDAFRSTEKERQTSAAVNVRLAEALQKAVHKRNMFSQNRNKLDGACPVR